MDILWKKSEHANQQLTKCAVDKCSQPLSHMQTRNDVSSYVKAGSVHLLNGNASFWFSWWLLLLLLVLLVLLLGISISLYAHFFLPSLSNSIPNTIGFLISFPVHVCVLFILSANNNYVCFARLMYIWFVTMGTSSAYIFTAYSNIRLKKKNIYTSRSVLSFRNDLTWNHHHTCSNMMIRFVMSTKSHTYDVSMLWSKNDHLNFTFLPFPNNLVPELKCIRRQCVLWNMCTIPLHVCSLFHHEK